MPKSISRWGMLSIICLYGFFVAFTMQAIPPVLSLVIADLDISHAQAGLFMSIFNLPGIFLIIPLSFASQRTGLKRLGLFSIVLLLLGTLIIVLAKSFGILLAGRLIIGLGAVALPVIGLQGVARYFMGYRLGLAMGIYSSTFPLASIFALNSFGTVGTTWGWRTAILITLVIGFIVLIMFGLYFRDPVDQPARGSSSNVLTLSSITKLGWPIWVLAISWGLANMGNQSLITFLPDFMYGNGMELQQAGSLSSIVMVCGLVLGTFSGYLLDKTRHKELYILIGGFFTALFIFLLPDNMKLIVLILVLIGIFSSGIPIAIFAVAPSLTAGYVLPLAYGIIANMSYVGLFAGPYITGYILDAIGSYRYSFWFLALVFLIVALLATVLLLRKASSITTPVIQD